ncbi:MAG: SDR family oxidoreductase [Proteobacteria bacterium]|nr:SDR family oxidoreductase [Pseudomonadota bacterium]
MERRKIAVVTGASSGIGLATAQALGRAGLDVFLVGRHPARLRAAAAGLPRGRLRGRAQADLASLDDLRALIVQVLGLGHVDLLVHCAGEYDRSEAGRFDPERFALLFDVNVRAPYLLTQGLLVALARARGQVVFVNSSVVRGAGEGVALYKSTQHAVQGLTDSLRQDLNRRGIRVTSLYPGRTATPRMARIYRREGKRYRPALLMSAADVAGVVVALAQLPAGVEVTDLHLRSVHRY